MEIKELRIGNFILGEYYDYSTEVEEMECSEVCEVLALDSVGVAEYSIWVEGKSSSVENYHTFEGIPITEEWLLKLGFEYNENYIQYKHPNCPLYFMIHPNKKTLLCFIHNCTNGTTKYVHQLQNLYFALNGKELTTKK